MQGFFSVTHQRAMAESKKVVFACYLIPIF